MIHFIIAGKPHCRNFIQAVSVACYLKRNLPAFDFTKYEYTDDNWDEYLVKTNREHNWHHGSSPLIYKELYFYGSKKPSLIGGLGEFWEYCYDYYGINCVMSEDEIDSMLQDNIKQFSLGTGVPPKSFKVLIYGAMNDMTPLLLPEFMKIEGCASTNMHFFLYDEKCENSVYFTEFTESFRDMYGVSAVYCDNLGEGLKDCNLLIFIDDTTDLESNEVLLLNYFLQIFYLAEEINLSGSRNLKIIFAASGLTCLIASMLVHRINISHTHVVVISSDLGLGYLGEMSRRLDINTKIMSAPPVWGFLGLNEFVDAGSTLIKCKVYKPYARAVHAPENSTLTHGTIHCELRFINYLSDEIKDLKETVDKRREIVKEKLQRAPLLAKLEALLNLINIWYGVSNLKDPIISLGIMSDGSFHIPENIMFSQPAIKFRDGWIPYSNYPVPENTLKSVKIAGQEADIHYKRYSDGDIFRKIKKSLDEHKMFGRRTAASMFNIRDSTGSFLENYKIADD